MVGTANAAVESAVSRAQTRAPRFILTRIPYAWPGVLALPRRGLVCAKCGPRLGLFAQVPQQELVGSVAATHERIYLDFLGELQSSVALLYKSLEKDSRIAGFLRGYRAVDHLETAARIEPVAVPEN